MHPSLRTKKRKKYAIGRIGGSNLSVTMVPKSKLKAGKRNYLGYSMVWHSDFVFNSFSVIYFKKSFRVYKIKNKYLRMRFNFQCNGRRISFLSTLTHNELAH